MRIWGPNENLTLSMADIEACHPVPGEGGRVLRAFCPIHGSDNQRSLRVDLETGRFKCFACGAWGYLREMRQSRPPSGPSPLPPPEPAARPDLLELLHRFQQNLLGKAGKVYPGQVYLEKRGIPLEIAAAYGAGYARPGTWPHKARDWKHGRVVFPHTNPDGEVVNLYGRAVGSSVPPEFRHDHLPGPRGLFNAAALRQETVFVSEGVFDALSLITAGYSNAVAIFGIDGIRWPWFRRVRRIIFALDADTRGQEAWRELAKEAVLRGKEVFYVPQEVYRGCKDLNEVWIKFRQLDVGKLDLAEKTWDSREPSCHPPQDSKPWPDPILATEGTSPPPSGPVLTPVQTRYHFEVHWSSERGWIRLRDPERENGMKFPHDSARSGSYRLPGHRGGGNHLFRRENSLSSGTHLLQPEFDSP